MSTAEYGAGVHTTCVRFITYSHYFGPGTSNPGRPS